MSERPAGWYPDPAGENRQRYWDGDSWADYYTPIPPSQPQLHGAATAASDYPYLSQTRTGSHHDLMATPTTAGPTSGWPTASPAGSPPGQGGQGGRGSQGETLEFSGRGRRGSAAPAVLVVASVLVVALVAGLAWWLVRGSGPDDDPTTAGPTSSGPPPTGGDVATGDVALDGEVTGTVPAAGTWVGALEIADDGSAVVLDVQADGGEDLYLVVRPVGGGAPLAEADDRAPSIVAADAEGFDPFAVTVLDAGSYEVVVTEVSSAPETGFTLTATTVTTALPPGEVVTAAVDGLWFGRLDVAADGPHVVDVQDQAGNDPVLTLVSGGGDVEFNDDRGDDDYDPLLEQDLTAGTWVVVVREYDGVPTEVSVEVTGP